MRERPGHERPPWTPVVPTAGSGPALTAPGQSCSRPLPGNTLLAASRQAHGVPPSALDPMITDLYAGANRGLALAAFAAR
jgi:hypothetical protein